MNVTPHAVALQFLDVEEVEGITANPLILSMLRLDNKWPADDSVPWCSAFVSFICWLMDLPRSKSLSARSWLLIGNPIPLEEARVGFDVVVLKRGKGQQPGPEVVMGAPGHVGFFDGLVGLDVSLLAGNQGNRVSRARFPRSQVLGVLRLAA